MMAVDRAQQLREARELFDFAQREGLSMQEAKARLAQRSWQAATTALATRRCGTAAPPIEPAPDGERAKPWYQQEPFA